MKKYANITNARPRLARRSLALAAGLAMLGGCASSPAAQTYAWRGHRAAAAMPMPGIYRYGPATDARLSAGHVGAEFSRLNNSLNARRRAPFSALGQWPEAIPPRESPIRFERWEQ